MRHLLAVIALLTCAAFVVNTTFAATLYEQEGTDDDADPVEVDAAGTNTSDTASTTNWKHQYGSGSWSGVYAGDDGWLTENEGGDSTLDIEADIEMYCANTINDNKVYFHLGNLYDATADDLTAHVTGTMTSNNGQYVGISFNGQGKTDTDFEKDGSGNYTGKIEGGMQSDRHSYGTQDEAMDLKILLSWGSGYEVPDNYGDGAHSTIHDTLWWLVDNGNAGSYNLDWKITLLPETDQADGDYYLDPAIVVAPVL